MTSFNQKPFLVLGVLGADGRPSALATPVSARCTTAPRRNGAWFSPRGLIQQDAVAVDEGNVPAGRWTRGTAQQAGADLCGEGDDYEPEQEQPEHWNLRFGLLVPQSRVEGVYQAGFEGAVRRGAWLMSQGMPVVRTSCRCGEGNESGAPGSGHDTGGRDNGSQPTHQQHIHQDVQARTVTLGAQRDDHDVHQPYNLG